MSKTMRVDDRLLHGQVIVSWTNQLKIDTIVVANDKVTEDVITKQLFKLACPSDIQLSIKTLEGAIAVINNEKHDKREMLIVVKNLKDAEYICRNTKNRFNDINIGGLGSGKNKTKISLTCYVSDDDFNTINHLESEGYNVYMQAVPNSQKMEVEEIRNAYNAREGV